MGSFNRLKKVIEENDKFAIICHERPDGDAIGSLLALGRSLEGAGKQVTRVCVDPVPTIYNFMGGKIQNFLNLESIQVIILVDNGDLNRTGLPDLIMQAKQCKIKIVNIDHHTKNDLWRIADVNYANEDASSASELVYEILTGLNYVIGRDAATNLLTGLHNDTGGFKHNNTTPGVLKIVSELLLRGANLKKISDNISNNHSVASMRLWGIALNRVKYDDKSGICYSVITKNDLKKIDASEDDVSGLVNLINAVPEAKFSLLLYETDNGKIKGSLRTEKNDINLSCLASFLGGGGHKKASGFSIDGKLQQDDNGGWRVV